MPPDLLQLFKAEHFYRDTLEKLVPMLPPGQEELDAWISECIASYNEFGYLLLSIATLHAGRPLDAKHLERGLSLCNHETLCPSLAWRSTGDVPGRVMWAVKNTFFFPAAESALHLLVAVWCQEHAQPLPPEIFSLARRVFRSRLNPVPALANLFCLAAITDDPGFTALAKVKAKPTPRPDLATWKSIAETMRQHWIKSGREPVSQWLVERPKEPSRVLAAGFTMRRAVAHTGRNDPCPCGSGKKYKHCCIARDEERLHHSSPVAGLTREEVAAAPEPHLTKATFNKTIGPTQLPKLDPRKLKPELQGEYFSRLAYVSHFDRILEMMPLMPWQSNIHKAWFDAMAYAARDGKLEVVRRLARLRGKEDLHLGDCYCRVGALALAENEPAEELRLIEEGARELMAADADAESLKGFADTLLFSRFRELGILVARGVIPMLPAKKASQLFEDILDARDLLNLPPDDPFSDIIDKRLLKQEPSAGDDKDTAIFHKAQRKLEKKAAEVRELKETLHRVQRDLELREKKEKRAAAETVVEPSAEEKKQTAELRSKLEQVKSSLKQTHLERNEVRRDLEQAHEELEKLRADHGQSDPAPQPDHEESFLLPPEPAASQPVRMLEFPKKFDETLRSVPRHIARNTMVTLGQIAGGEPAGFVGARRLNVCEDITRQRIGSDYRLLFRLLPDRVQVVTLINRRDLDRTIKSLKNTP
jgi:hypothetical protein